MKQNQQTLGAVADLQLGKMLDEKKNKGVPRPYLANVNVRWGSFDLENLREMRFEDDELQQFGLRNGDIVMCEGGEPGRCAIWSNKVEGMMFQKALHRIRAGELLHQRYLFYRLLLMGRSGAFASLFTGSTIKHLPRQNLMKVAIEFPDLSAQSLIASILSAYDDLIGNNLRRMALLEDAARKLYREWFVRFRFPGHENTRVFDGVPAGWARKTLDDLCEAVREIASPDQVDAETPYIGLEHIPRRSISQTEWGSAEEVTSSKHKFGAGDILFGKIRPYFHKVSLAFVDGVASADAIVIRPKEADFHSLVLLTVSSDAFVAMASQTMREGSKMPRADWKQMQAYEVLQPSLQVLEAFNRQIIPITQQLRNFTFQSRKLRAARDRLLPKLMSGEIEV